MHVLKWFFEGTETVESIFFSKVGRKVFVPPLVEGMAGPGASQMFGGGNSKYYLEDTGALPFGCL